MATCFTASQFQFEFAITVGANVLLFQIPLLYTPLDTVLGLSNESLLQSFLPLSFLHLIGKMLAGLGLKYDFVATSHSKVISLPSATKLTQMLQ